MGVIYEPNNSTVFFTKNLKILLFFSFFLHHADRITEKKEPFQFELTWTSTEPASGQTSAGFSPRHPPVTPSKTGRPPE